MIRIIFLECPLHNVHTFIDHSLIWELQYRNSSLGRKVIQCFRPIFKKNFPVFVRNPCIGQGQPCPHGVWTAAEGIENGESHGLEFSFGLILESKNVLDTTLSGSLRNRFCSSIGRAAKSRHSSEQQPFNFSLQDEHWINKI